MGTPEHLASGTPRITRVLASGDFSSGSVIYGNIGSGSVTSGNIGTAAVCQPNMTADALALMVGMDLSHFRVRGTCSGLKLSAGPSSGVGQRWYCGGVSIGRQGHTFVGFYGDYLYCLPLCSEMGGYIDDMRAYKNGGTSGKFIGMGIYANVDDTMADIWPGSLLVQTASGGLSLSGGGAVNFAPNISIDPNKIYWLAIKMPAASGASFRHFYYSTMNLWGAANDKFGDANAFGIKMAWSGTDMPSTFPTSSGEPVIYGAEMPALGVHFAS